MAHLWTVQVQIDIRRGEGLTIYYKVTLTSNQKILQRGESAVGPTLGHEAEDLSSSSPCLVQIWLWAPHLLWVAKLFTQCCINVSYPTLPHPNPTLLFNCSSHPSPSPRDWLIWKVPGVTTGSSQPLPPYLTSISSLSDTIQSPIHSANMQWHFITVESETGVAVAHGTCMPWPSSSSSRWRCPHLHSSSLPFSSVSTAARGLFLKDCFDPITYSLPLHTDIIIYKNSEG